MDDAVAIIRSANINERSLSRTGDSEFTTVIVDSGNAQLMDLGQSVKTVNRKLVRDLRMKLWKKHFGMLIDTLATGVQTESAPTWHQYRKHVTLQASTESKH